jgi:type IV secretory pathway VirB10-like protein
MRPATFSRPPWAGLPVTRLRVGRVVLLAMVTFAALIGGTIWLLRTQARPLTMPLIDRTAWPAWMRQAQTYPTSEPEAPKPAAPATDPNAALLAKLAALQADLDRQRQELEALKKRPSGTTGSQPQQAQAAKVTPPPKPHASMLFVSHDLKEPPPKPSAAEYTLAPGATKLPCLIETAINSDVEGYFTAKVSTNVYDTATGRHLLVPQGSTILGHDQSSILLYGNERLPTISLTLALPDGRSVDLGQAPVTDQQGVAGLTGRVNQHYWRLFGAVCIGGALRGGMQALQVATAQAGGAGQVASGIAATGNQATQQRLGRALDTRPTIEVDSGQLCQVLLTKPLHLPAMWQYGGQARATRAWAPA